MNPRVQYSWLVLRALWELIRYEATIALRGFGSIQRRLKRQRPVEKVASPELQQAIRDAVLLAIQ